MDNNENKNSKEVAKRDNNEFSFFDPFFDGFFGFPTFRNEFKEMEKMMKADIHETENNYEIELELAGYEKKDIDIELKNNYLTIVATRDNSEKDQNEEKKCKNCIRRERFYGKMARSFYVGEIQREDISASLNNGILTITVPKEKTQKELNKIDIK